MQSVRLHWLGRRNNNMVKEHGFDLTSFGTAENFKKVLKENKLSIKGKRKCTVDKDYAGVSTKMCQFEWKNKDVKLITSNNPITGQYNNPKRRKPEKGYASYIGIVGDDQQVPKLVESIKKHARDIKDESRGRRDFI